MFCENTIKRQEVNGIWSRPDYVLRSAAELEDVRSTAELEDLRSTNILRSVAEHEDLRSTTILQSAAEHEDLRSTYWAYFGCA